MSVEVAQTLLDAMRGVIDRGTGTGIRYRFGIQADVAGKTGTTQDNTDGWFILMHPQLVAGAWVGFNDNRITMGNRWGQGAHSALPMVGEFFQQAFNSRVVDQQVRFGAPQASPRSWGGGAAGEAEPVPVEESGASNGEALPEGRATGRQHANANAGVRRDAAGGLAAGARDSLHHRPAARARRPAAGTGRASRASAVRAAAARGQAGQARGASRPRPGRAA